MSYNHSNVRPDLIELVRMNECIYNPKHKHYKNKPVKVMIWEEIGAKLNLDVQKARELWRTLRDGYIRYKKALKNGKKHTVYSWSEHLSFLDDVLDAKDADATQDGSQHQVYFSEDLYAKMNMDSPGQQAGDCWNDSVASSPTQDFNGQSYPYRQAERKPKKRKASDSMDKIIDYLQSKKKKEYDAVDLLFMSYAKTFKSLSARTQAKLKVTLAKVFAEAEFGNLGAETEPMNG
ncbi:hypothetical protein ABMA27_006405 [Loxostege sticticalis]|uniref:MADF domain-containing protein n=1 Tax=Loxostege sticticalis TaxID=481309 RepID=A0ABR3IJ25_LOXSC